MRSLLAPLALALGIGTFSSVTEAQGQTPAPLACEAERAKLASQEQTVGRLQSQLRDAETRLDVASETAAELARTQAGLNAAKQSLSSCESTREGQCRAARTLTSSLASGRFAAGELSECIDPGAQQQIVQNLSGATNVTSALRQFVAYSSGETSIVPQLGPTSGASLEKLVARLFPPGAAPLVYRRLLIAAVEEVAPRAWAQISQPPGGVNSWFTRAEPLDESIIAESRKRFGQGVDQSSGSNASLTNALQLVGAYEILGDCQGIRPAIDCARARQLRSVLEVSGPLILRRRSQDIWATQCANIGTETILSWLDDVPGSASSEADSASTAQTIHLKLLGCYLGDSTQDVPLSTWLASKTPAATGVTAKNFVHLKNLERTFKVSASIAACTEATRSLKSFEPPASCQVESEFVENLHAWTTVSVKPNQEWSPGFALCDRFNRALWSGETATIPDSFETPPNLEDMVKVGEHALASPLHRLRQLCTERTGQGDQFIQTTASLSTIGARLGEDPASLPWKVKEGRPVESHLIRRADGMKAWLGHFNGTTSACGVLEMSEARCELCQDSSLGTHFDCSQVRAIEKRWQRKNYMVIGLILGVLLLVLLIAWMIRLRRALKIHGEWSSNMRRRFVDLGLSPQLERSRFIFPSKFSRILVRLPHTAVWRRWGDTALVMRSIGDELRGIEVNRAAAAAQKLGAHLTFIVHKDRATPNLSSVRAILEWSTRGSKAVQVVPLAFSRMNWSHDALDLLELAEESSLRSNPFEVRGRVNTSSQFFNRERLVSGLLASAQSGHVTVVTGLRRFGKSSLALEVARRLPGPSAYVDLAGFHHEIRFSKDPAEAADAILRFLCHRLLDSARSRAPSDHEMSLEVPSGSMDATTLTSWFHKFDELLKTNPSGDGAPPVLIILDEVEQAFGAAKELGHALDVLGILVGRLRNSLPGALHERTQRVGILFCSALHPLLWSPLGSLAHQSLIGSFQYVAVPCLPDEASREMMNGLGARQGIRFTDQALNLLIRESQGVPLLLRRLGSVVLELYDPERAHQGALGAVEIGIEGARAAIEREESEGSPLRVWIESEIAEPESPGGSVLRALSVVEWMRATELRRIASKVIQAQFTATGLSSALSEEEGLRRAQEAAAVVVRMLGHSGLLNSRGDPTEPEGYELPDGVIRRILKLASSEFPSARPAQ